MHLARYFSNSNQSIKQAAKTTFKPLISQRERNK